jgi:hypothetical protein
MSAAIAATVGIFVVVAIVILMWFLMKDKDKDNGLKKGARLVMKTDGTMFLRFTEDFISSEASYKFRQTNPFDDEDIGGCDGPNLELCKLKPTYSSYDDRPQTILDLYRTFSFKNTAINGLPSSIISEINEAEMKTMAKKLLVLTKEEKFSKYARFIGRPLGAGSVDLGQNYTFNDQGLFALRSGVIAVKLLDIFNITLGDSIPSELLNEHRVLKWAGSKQSHEMLVLIVAALGYMKENNFEISKDTIEWETYPASKNTWSQMLVQQDEGSDEGVTLMQKMIDYAIINDLENFLYYNTDVSSEADLVLGFTDPVNEFLLYVLIDYKQRNTEAWLILDANIAKLPQKYKTILDTNTFP